jgi:hypothetical protein
MAVVASTPRRLLRERVRLPGRLGAHRLELVTAGGREGDDQAMVIGIYPIRSSKV